VQAALSKSVLSQDDVIQKICELTQQRLLSPESDIVYEQEAADILSQLSALSQLTDQQRKQILQAANSLCDPGYRFHALSGLVPQQPSLARPLPEFCQGDDYRSFLGVKLQLALSDAPIASHLVDRITPGSYRRIEASVAIACKSPESAYQSRALEDIRRIDNTYLKTQYIQQLTPYLINAQRLEAANLIREIGHPYHKTQALVKLACKFPEFRSEAKNTAQRTLLNPVHKIEQLSLLAIEVPEILPEMIDVVEQLQRPIEQTEALIALAPHLPTRINRAIKREYSANFFVSAALWKQALYLLSRSYRDAIKGGSLRNDSAQDKDFLNIQDEVNALANLLLMRDLDPPMAVGILGGWGGGKSYIMHLMQAHMTKVRSYATTETEAWDADPNSEKLSPYVGHIYQIRFDAWTFAKSDLWASLMQTIFFELDRQLTLETQITEVLSGIKDIDKRQAIEQKIWPVLYKSTDDEREWFLKRVLTDRSILEALIQKQKATGSAGILWQKFKESQVTAIDTLAATEAALEQKKAVLETVKAELRSQARQEFEPIFSLTNRRSFQHVDALLGTSFALLRSRIGKNSFKQLNRDIAEQLFDIPSQKTGEQSPDEKSIGMWKRLEAKLSDLDAARRTLEKLEDSQLSEESAENENGQKIEADEQSVPNTARESVTKTGASETDLINQQQQEVNRLLVEVSELRFDIFNVAATVIERKRKFLDHRRNCQWVISNLPLLLLFTVLFLAPLGVIAFLNWNVYKDLDSQIPNLTGKVAAAVAPLLPGIAILQNLVRSGQKWFEETSLALNEYKVSVEKRNKELETTYERVMQESLTSNPRLRQLEAEVQALEQDYEAQKQAVPINQYATLSDFIRDRLDQGTYTKRLGPMQQVKQDLSELSNKLLPPRQYDQSFQAKLEFLKSAFPRGPARVAVYIDDLDRCPPDRVVQVLEAVQLLIKTPLFIAVLAIDERYITRALEKFYSGILLRNGSPSGTDYLEKIIQLPYRVRPIMTNTLETYLRSQVVIQDNAAGISKFSEFSRHEFEMLLECCRQIDLSPRTIKRLTNVYKLFKIVCRTRSSKPTPRVQQTTLALLALSGRYPQLMRGIFNNIQNCFEEQRTKENAQARKNPFHLECSLQTFFQMHRVSGQQIYLQSELEKLRYDAVRTHILPDDITLIELSQGIFNLIRSFSFVGDIGQDPDNYSISNSHYLDHNPPDNLSLFNNS
ncbi:MAG: P-loop NTPase fold protein, partial [Cyanobacteria bacterium J06650_10]